MKISKKSSKILIVEDESVSAKFLQNMLYMSSLNISKIESVASLDAASKILDKDYFDVVLLDLNLPDSTGLDTIVSINKRYPDIAIIVMTVIDEKFLGLKALASGAQEYLVKGRYNIDLLVRSIYYAIERKRLDKDIKRAAKVWEETFDSIAAMISIHDKDCKILKANKACSDFFKMKPEELVGKNWHELLHGTKEPEENCLLRQAMESKKSTTKEVFESHMGIYLEISVSPIFDDKGEVIGSVHIAKDISEHRQSERELLEAYSRLKQAQDQLIRMEKMAAVGRLAAGVAHEINNPLNVISGYAELLLTGSQDEEVKMATGKIIEQTRRAATITDRLLQFSRQKKPKIERLNVNKVLEETLLLLEHETKYTNIDIIKEFCSSLSEVMADFVQLQEVFFNIMLNAIQAMPEGGRLTIRIYSKEITEHGRRETDKFKPGSKIVVIEIEDTGEGITEEELGMVFEPFFSTKERGTGLGLSICYGIIEAHQGIIDARSKTGEGTTFIIQLPIPGKEAQDA